ncbi:MAG: hypothetical protein HY749_07945 [Gammaproteobacteria bacterium]|nr:hypothetical protein [Gammaproteobacteria bacterium]
MSAPLASRRVANLAPLLDPSHADWERHAATRIALAPTPLGLQPTPYVRNTWKDRPYGALLALDVASVHDGRGWALRASWEGVSAPGDFPDALAIALPLAGRPVLATMGSAEAPIHYLRWRADREAVSSQIAHGIGSSAAGPPIAAHAAARAAGTRWQLVVSRPLGAPHGAAALQAGVSTQIGFAVWCGGNDERAGIKAFSIDWLELALDA